MSAAARLAALLGERVIVLDGAIGTWLMTTTSVATVPTTSGSLDLLTLTRPGLVRAVHEAYLDAGADIISTNTFCSDTPSLVVHGTEALSYTISAEAARLARGCTLEWTARTPAKPRFVAGVIGPSRGPLVVPPGPGAESDDALVAASSAYRPQVRGLLDGGVDLLLVETAVHVGNARAAMAAIRAECEARQVVIPVMISTTPTTAMVPALALAPSPDAHPLWDHCHTALGRAAFSLGLNCGDGASKLADVVSHLAHTARTFVSCHPSAGLPDRAGRYPASPSEFADSLADLARAGWLNIVGGCCGTTPDHIRALAAAVEGVPPRRLPGRLPRPGR